MESALPSATAPAARPSRPRAIARLLFLVAALVFAMVVVGGITRLTESGLSITEWKPIAGAIPPLTHADWSQAFDLYKTIPEYRQINGPAGMTLATFKHIYWWEFAHRLLGRVIGLVFAAGLAWFAWKRAIPKGYGWKMVGLLALGGAQGLLGWYMVVSGLTQRTDVSHLRLSAHLLLALAIMGALIWVALDLRRLAATGQDRPSRLTLPAAATLAVLFVQVMFGAWVAGLNAGQVASDWPLMQGRFFPEGVDWSHGALWAFTNDPYLIHFVHRWWAWVVVGALIVFARKVRKVSRPASIAIHSAFGTQIILGIATVMSGVAIWLAALHQAVGALLVAAAVWGTNEVGRRRVRA
jgi:cytochrome c oxidase assembly protein subunit 15